MAAYYIYWYMKIIPQSLRKYAERFILYTNKHVYQKYYKRVFILEIKPKFIIHEIYCYLMGISYCVLYFYKQIIK